MSYTKLSSPTDADLPLRSSSASVRPQSNSQLTSDRLRESSTLRSPPFKMGGNIRKGRQSVFKEIGLEDDGDSDSPAIATTYPTPTEHSKTVEYPESTDERSLGKITGLEPRPGSGQQDNEGEGQGGEKEHKESEASKTSRNRPRQSSLSSWYAKIANPKSRPRVRTESGAPPGAVSGLQRFTMLAALIAIVLPALGWFGFNGADAGMVSRRENSPTKTCARWAHQAALLNGTLYIYGGRAKAEGDQENNTWNNYFLTLDLTKDWETGSPSLRGLPRPDGPPAVAMGYLWHDYNDLFLYGGQFSDSPYVSPEPESLWRYSISSGKWTEFPDPKTSAGNDSEPAEQPVHRAAEGAGLSVPELGLSWYFGGHLDWATTPGWSRDVDRVYLKTLLEFTHPGYVNSGVDELSDGTGAGEWGAFRNISKGGVQADKFPERADGVLVFVPGWGESGVLIGLAGGTAEEFTHDLGSLDVYDIANSEWFHQETSGDIPGVRVNPCAVVASAPDASSFQIYMFGGQNLQPYANQTQYDDMYILTIPSFTWIRVEKSDKTPSPRAGHTCTLCDGQIIVVGGYIGNNDDCDGGFYVFDATTLTWKSSFEAGAHRPDFHPDNAVLAASFGYSVPEAVQKIIGGSQEGGATATTPASGPATGGPFLTGKPPVFTVTQSGATATVTGDAPDDAGDDGNDASPRLIAAGVIAGVLGALALYLGWCAWLYRRQVGQYRRHLAITKRYSGASSASCTSLMPPPGTAQRGRNSPESFAWVGSTDGPSSSSRLPSEGKQSEETRPRTSGSGNSTEGLLEGQEPSFISVVMGPRRALRVVNGVE